MRTLVFCENEATARPVKRPKQPLLRFGTKALRRSELMTKWTNRFVVLCACLLLSASLYAHHSLAGVYALGKEAKVTGAFKAFRLVNPHSSLRIDVTDKDGKTVEWAIVGGSVTQIARLGLGRTNEGPNALHPGDEIT